MMERLASAPAGTDAGQGNKKPFFSVAAEGRGSGSFRRGFPPEGLLSYPFPQELM